MIIVTRHPALVAYLAELGYIGKVVAHATADDVRGQHVVGVLPLRLATLAASITEVPMDIPPDLRGVELTLELVRAYAGQPVTYRVTREGD